MDEEEIESLYEEEKERLEEAYLQQLAEGKDKEETEKDYTARFTKARDTYNRRMETFLKNKAKKRPIRAFILKTKQQWKKLIKK